jgi:dTDP-4-dehydrorhamnose 3,5-epimerase
VNWKLPSTTRDAQSVTADWQPSGEQLIDGVRLREVRNVVRDNRVITELYRSDWALDDESVGQVFQSLLMPGAVSAWHAHAETIDRLAVVAGTVKVVLYDNRAGSPTFGRINELRLGPLRPATLVVPAKVYHGIQNIGAETAVLLNMPDRAYRYETPDHWRIAWDSDEIPYRFDAARSGSR